MTPKELSWIDDFIKSIKKHIYIRDIDKVLILPPNKVYKLNDSAFYILSKLISGNKINKIKEINSDDRRKEVHYFFCDLKAFYTGCLSDINHRKAVESVPYDFNYTKLPVLGEIRSGEESHSDQRAVPE